LRIVVPAEATRTAQLRFDGCPASLLTRVHACNSPTRGKLRDKPCRAGGFWHGQSTLEMGERACDLCLAQRPSKDHTRER
jgi:hypothetical protein